MKNWRKFYDLEDEDDIYCAGETIEETLDRHYSESGEIINIKILDKHLSFVGFGCAIIQMNDGRVANAFILNRLDSIQYRVYAFEPTMEHLEIIKLYDDNDDFYSLPRRQIVSSARKRKSVAKLLAKEPPGQKSPSNILNALNDDCLQQIFERLPIEDLCSVAETCKKFRFNVERISSLQFDKFTPTTNNLYQLERLLRHFGNRIKSLSIDGRYQIRMEDNLLLLTLATYCSNAKCQLEALSIYITDIQPMCFTILQPIFQRLKRLRVYSQTMNHNLDPFNENRMLRTLSVRSCICNHEILYKTLLKFPNLHQLEIHSCHLFDGQGDEYLFDDPESGSITAESMLRCVERMKFLKKLTLHPSQTLCLYDSMDIFQILANAQVELEWLIINGSRCFHNFDVFSLSLQKLKHIKILELCEFRHNGDALLELVENLPNLNELHLKHNCLSIGDIKELAKCDTLTMLTFTLNRNETLEPVDDVCFDELLHLVMKRTPSKKLTIQIQSFNTVRLHVTQEKINTNLETLEIKILPKIEQQ